MKTVIACFALVLTMGACQSASQIVNANESSNRFAQFRNLGDALRGYNGLYVSGTGVNRTVQMSRNGAADALPMFVLNGFPLGKSYLRANNAVNMHAVKSIRVVRSLSEMNRYGLTNEGGLIVIETNALQSNQKPNTAPTILQVGQKTS